MRTPFRMLSCLPLTALAFGVLGLFASPAHAQEVRYGYGYAPPPPPPPGVVVYDEHYCGGRWWAPSRRCGRRHYAHPVLMLGADLGISAMNESGPFGFNNGVGGFTHPGPAWGARIGVEFNHWIALEARYVGMYNAVQTSASPAGSLGFSTTGAEAVLRLTLPLPFIHPYIFGGVGYYNVELTGTSQATSGSVLFSSSQPGIPMGFGVDIPLTWHVSIGAEATYHFQVGELYSDSKAGGIDGGDISTFNAVLRVRL